MNFDKRLIQRNLGGATGKETSRNELLKQVKAERAVREKERQVLKAILLVQRVLRGLLVRRRLRKELLVDWLRRFSPSVADTKCRLSAQALSVEVLPPLLFLYLPWTVGRAAQHSKENTVHEVVAVTDDTAAAALRGAIALVLRSIQAQDAEQNYVTWAASAARRQRLQLMLLCAGLLAAPHLQNLKGGSELLENAAARLLMALSIHENSGSVSTEDQDACMRGQIAAASAVRRLLQRWAGLAGQAAEGAQVTGCEDEGSRKRQDTTLNWAMEAALHPILADASSSNQGSSVRQESAAAAKLVALRILTAPDLANSLPEGSRVQLAKAEVFVPLTNALTSSLKSETEFQSGVTSTSGRMLESGTDLSSCSSWMWALANTSSIIAGQPVRRALQDGHAVRFFKMSSLLRQPGVATSFLIAAERLLQAANAAPPDKPASLSGALEALWPLGDGTFVGHLIAALKGTADNGVPLLASFYCTLIEALPKLASAAGMPQGSEALPYINALAFGNKGFLAQLWKWLGMNLGLPLEAHQEATRGWNIESLRQGTRQLLPQQAAIFGLFCRLYAHFLLVLDDEDFYELQQTFSLGQQRAVATALNTLVFRTHCPESLDMRSSPSRESGNTLLARRAPVLLRALYERDVRRRYCPPALWLAPFAATGAATSQEAGSFSEAAMRALLQATSDDCPKTPGPAAKSAAWATLLMDAPHCVPFQQRVEVFRRLVAADKERGRWGSSLADGGPAAMRITVRRGALLEDGYAALKSAGSMIKGRLAVTFVNEVGILEAGLDHGGLVKEFLEEVVKAGFNADFGLMTSTREGLAYPQPAAAKLPQGLGLLEFLGMMLGKALYDGILLDWPLAPFFVARLQGTRPFFDDLSSLDADLHRNLLQLKRYPGEAEDLGLGFTVEDETFGSRTSIPLVPGGDSVAVTNANKLQYIHLLADWHLNGRLGASAAAFASGMAQVIPAPWLRLFNPSEVNQLLAGGESGGVDVADMTAHTEYSGGYTAGCATIKLFWRVVSEMSQKERQALLKFATSCSRAPLGGFQHLRPPFCVHKVPCAASPFVALGGKDVQRLPSASTCYNMLKLPDYRKASTMRKSILYAVSSNTGFELS